MAPLLQVPPLVFPLNTTYPPAQKVIGPPEVTVEATGKGLTMIVILFEVAVVVVAHAILEVKIHLKTSLFAADAVLYVTFVAPGIILLFLYH